MKEHILLRFLTFLLINVIFFNPAFSISHYDNNNYHDDIKIKVRATIKASTVPGCGGDVFVSCYKAEILDGNLRKVLGDYIYLYIVCPEMTIKSLSEHNLYEVTLNFDLSDLENAIISPECESLSYREYEELDIVEKSKYRAVVYEVKAL